MSQEGQGLRQEEAAQGSALPGRPSTPGEWADEGEGNTGKGGLAHHGHLGPIPGRRAQVVTFGGCPHRLLCVQAGQPASGLVSVGQWVALSSLLPGAVTSAAPHPPSTGQPRRGSTYEYNSASSTIKGLFLLTQYQLGAQAPRSPQSP